MTRRVKQVVHLPILFKNKPIEKISSHKYLGLVLDPFLTFDEHIKAISSNVSKAIGLLQKLNNRLPCSSLTTIYKSFVKPNLDYGDEIFDKAYIHSFQQRLESCQYKASLTVLSAIKCSPPENFYQELGLKSLQSGQGF